MTAAERIAETAADAERYSRGLITASTVATYARIGADVALHELSMRLVDHGKRSISTLQVAKLIGEIRTAIDAAKTK